MSCNVLAILLLKSILSTGKQNRLQILLGMWQKQNQIFFLKLRYIAYKKCINLKKKSVSLILSQQEKGGKNERENCNYATFTYCYITGLSGCKISIFHEFQPFLKYYLCFLINTTLESSTNSWSTLYDNNFRFFRSCPFFQNFTIKSPDSIRVLDFLFLILFQQFLDIACICNHR